MWDSHSRALSTGNANWDECSSTQRFAIVLHPPPPHPQPPAHGFQEQKANEARGRVIRMSFGARTFSFEI